MIYAVLGLCVLASLACAALLVRGWRRTEVGLLLACALCFTGMSLSHLLRMIERAYALDRADHLFGALVQVPTLLGIGALIWGLVKASE